MFLEALLQKESVSKAGKKQTPFVDRIVKWYNHRRKSMALPNELIMESWAWVPACNPRTWRQKQEEPGYMARIYQEEKDRERERRSTGKVGGSQKKQNRKKIRKREKERAEFRSLQLQHPSPGRWEAEAGHFPEGVGAGSVSLVPENSQASLLVNTAVRPCPLKQSRKARANTHVVTSTAIHTHTRGRREDIKRINC